jgi:hypothetical protein
MEFLLGVQMSTRLPTARASRVPHRENTAAFDFGSITDRQLTAADHGKMRFLKKGRQQSELGETDGGRGMGKGATRIDEAPKASGKYLIL